jgi:hypothetical protein
VLGADGRHRALQHDRPVGQPGRPGAVQVVDAAEAGVQLAAPQCLQRGRQAAAHAQLNQQFGVPVQQPANQPQRRLHLPQTSTRSGQAAGRAAAAAASAAAARL